MESAGQISPQELTRIALKKRVWKIPTLPKIRMFLWRVISGAVAVAERLNSRRLGVEPACKLCNDGAETINHVLFQCTTASRIWADVGVALPAGVLQHSLEENVAYVFDAMQDLSKTEAIRHSIPWVL